MSDLILNSLVIENFRILKKLEIDPLKRINLLVGENNSGKTTVLEALRFYATRAEFIATWLMLNARDETSDDNFIQQQSSTPIRNIQYLFHRDIVENGAPQKTLSIGSLSGDQLSLGFSQNKLVLNFKGYTQEFNSYDYFLKLALAKFKEKLWLFWSKQALTLLIMSRLNGSSKICMLNLFKCMSIWLNRGLTKYANWTDLSRHKCVLFMKKTKHDAFLVISV
ncbi:AAA family ATPase [Deltaproteobacteria bacterium TL4]